MTAPPPQQAGHELADVQAATHPGEDHISQRGGVISLTRHY